MVTSREPPRASGFCILEMFTFFSKKMCRALVIIFAPRDENCTVRPRSRVPTTVSRIKYNCRRQMFAPLHQPRCTYIKHKRCIQLFCTDATRAVDPHVENYSDFTLSNNYSILCKSCILLLYRARMM